MEQFVEQLFQDPIFHSPESILSVVVILLSATLLTLPVAWVYMLTRKKKGYKQSFVQALIFLSVITAAVMLVIGNNLARAFGLVGAVSIIRFRSQVNNPKDIAYIFAVITIGMASGLGLYSVAFLTSLLMNLFAIIFWKYDFAASGKTYEYILTIETESISSTKPLIAESLQNLTDRWKLEKVSSDDGSKFRLEYLISFNGKVSLDQLLHTLWERGKNNYTFVECVDVKKKV